MKNIIASAHNFLVKCPPIYRFTRKLVHYLPSFERCLRSAVQQPNMRALLVAFTRFTARKVQKNPKLSLLIKQILNRFPVIKAKIKQCLSSRGVDRTENVSSASRDIKKLSPNSLMFYRLLTRNSSRV